MALDSGKNACIITKNSTALAFVSHVLLQRGLVCHQISPAQDFLSGEHLSEADLIFYDLQNIQQETPSLSRLTALFPDTPVLVVLDEKSPEIHEKILLAGAWDCIFSSQQEKVIVAILEKNLRLAKRQKALAKRNRNLHNVVDASVRLASATDMKTLAALLMREFSRIVEAQGGSFFIRAPESFDLLFALDPPHAPDSIPCPPFPGGVLDQVISTKKTLLISRFSKEQFQSSGWRGYKNDSSLALPLLDRDQSVVGVVFLHDKRHPPFTSEDRSAVSLLAAMATEAVGTVRAIEAEKESEKRYRLIAENASDVIWILDMDFRYIYVSPSLERLRGFAPSEILGKTITHSLTPESLDIARRTLAEKLRADRKSQQDVDLPATLELETVCKDGSTVWTEAKTSFLRDKDGKPQAILGVSRDISQRKDLENQLQRTQKLEALGTLAGGVAHDFNNILGAIIGYAEISKEDAADNPDLSANLNEVLKAANRARDLISQILTFSRKTEHRKQPVGLSSITKETIKLLKATFPTTIKIRQSIKDNIGQAMADPSQIHQVLMNLCTNARHAIGEKEGELQVSLTRHHFKTIQDLPEPHMHPGDYLKLSVEDTGEGMSEEMISRIFDPYFTTKTKGEGTGLGLAVVLGIVKSHQGAIVVKSLPGQGSCFDVYLPVVKQSTSPQNYEKAHVKTGKESILVVDDEKALVNLITRILTRLGYSITGISDSREAFSLFCESPDKFDLIITDQTMPHKTGKELAADCMKIRPNTPIILCTGFSEQIDEASATKLGIRGFLLKPLTTHTLANKVRDILDNKQKTS